MKVLMVCLGNICRSPLAEGLLQKKISKNGYTHSVDSAGTSNHHVGEQPDSRMQNTAKSFNYPIDNLRARQFKSSDFTDFDLIYVMDKSNLENVLKLAKNKDEIGKVKLILNESNPGKNLEVPDPYFGGNNGFIEVFELLDEATDYIIKNLEE